MDKIRFQVEGMMNLEMELLRKRETKHMNEISWSPVYFLITGLFSLLVFIGAFFKIHKEIKKVKKINNQLLINQETFEHAEQIANMSTWCWNIKTNTQSYSDNQYRLLGCEPKEFEPTMEKFIEFVHPEDRHIITTGSEKAMASTPSIVYFRIIRKDGEIRHFKSAGKFIIDIYGKKILIGVNADITEQYVKDRTLEEKIFDLERTNNELSAFNHVASHDLQEPLRKIQTFVTRIIETDLNLLSEKSKDYFSRIKASANRMQNLIDDLLAYSRANKADKVFELTDLNILLEHSKQELAQIIEEKNAIIQSSKLPVLNVIPFQIHQLLNNIIGNSLKYSNPEIKPIVKINAKIITDKEIPQPLISSDKKIYQISITDNGIGFEQKYAENIFTLFHRLHNDKTYSGTGIGLTICKKIVENHKGYINATSIPGVGSTFTIYLPEL